VILYDLRLMLFAFGFESLLTLFWLPAAAAPLLIHLLSRRKYSETAWAAMTFLLAAAKRRTRRIRVEQWILLLVRTLVIVVLVAAVAEPYLEHALPVFGPHASTHRVLVIDSSYSMAYKASDRTRFEQAKQWALRIVEKSPPGDGFTLVQMANPPRVIVATPGLEAGSIKQEIQGLELIHTGADLAATLVEVRKLLDTARRDSPRLSRNEVYFFTDLQRGTWMPAVNDAKKAQLRSNAEELAALAQLSRQLPIQLQVLDLGQPGDDNLAVTSLAVTSGERRDPVFLVDRSVALEASVRDFGRVARQHQAVDLLIDGSPAGRQYVDIPAGGSAVARFNARFESAGDHAVEVRLVGDPTKPGDYRGPADALEIDNHRYLAVNVRQAIRVLCVDGRPSGDPRKSSTAALVVALSSRGDPKVPSPIDIDVAPESAIQERPLGRYDCVMLSDVAQFTESEARALESYLTHGGSLVFFLGGQVIAGNYNRVLADSTRQILPARLVGVAKNPGGRLDPFDYRHPIVAKFRNRENTKLLESPVDRYFKVKIGDAGVVQASRLLQPAGASLAGGTPAPPLAEVALALGNGDPLIVAQSVRRGRVVLVTTSADTSWNLLPVLGNYEPLVKEILAWCLGGQAKPGNVEAGELLESAVPAASAPSQVSVERPGGQSRSVPVEVQGDYGTWRYDDTFVSGVYTARFGPPLSQNRLFAVNLQTAESDLSAISHDELQNEVWPGVAIGYATSWQGDDAPLLLPASSAAQLPVTLFYVVVALMLLETILAWRFGYNTR
jgi:hypothetical protein